MIVYIIILIILFEIIGRKKIKIYKGNLYDNCVKEYKVINSNAYDILDKLSTLMYNHKREDAHIFLSNGSITYELFVMINNIFDLYDRVNDSTTTREEMIEIAHTIEGRILHNGILSLIDMPYEYSSENIPDHLESYYFLKTAVLDANYYKLDLHGVEYVQFYCNSCNSKLDFISKGYKCSKCGKEAVKISVFRKIYVKYIESILIILRIFLKVIGIFLRIIFEIIDIFL